MVLIIIVSMRHDCCWRWEGGRLTTSSLGTGVGSIWVWVWVVRAIGASGLQAVLHRAVGGAVWSWVRGYLFGL